MNSAIQQLSYISHNTMFGKTLLQQSNAKMIRFLSFKLTSRQRTAQDLFIHKKVQHTGGNEFSLIFGVFAGASSLVCFYIYGDMLITSAYNHYRGIMSSNWLPTLGSISRTELRQKTLLTSKFSHIYQPHVVYSYKVDDNYFWGDRLRFSQDLRSTENQAKAQISTFKPGQSVMVFYDPQNPSDSVLQKGPQNQMPEILMSVTGVGIGSFMLWMSLHLLRPRQMARDFISVFRKHKL